MNLILAERFPTWLIGCYGGFRTIGSATPTLDRLALSGVVFDFVYETRSTGAPNRPKPLSRMIPGVRPARLVLSELAVEAALKIGEEAWTEIIQFWIDDGFDFDLSTGPGDIFSLQDTDLLAELFDDDIVLSCDPAAKLLNTVELLDARRVDAELAEHLQGMADEPIAVAALAGGVPAGVLSDPLLDVWRHVPVVVAGPQVPQSRQCGLFAIDALLEPIASDEAIALDTMLDCAVDHLILQAPSGIAVRCDDGLLTREVRDREPYERFFVKPGDRWNQLNVAAQEGEQLGRYRDLLTRASQ